MNNAIVINCDDNVATVLTDLKKNDYIHYTDELCDEIVIKCLENIPSFHKIAIKNILCGTPVIKYGEIIGVANCLINTGQHVHINNVISACKKNEGK
ncbi:MAG: UxaA family hydrolase [Bacilli bacterium]